MLAPSVSETRVYFAHSARDGGPWQPLQAHLRAVADSARTFAAPFGQGDTACLAGIFHDLGKYSATFQARLHDPKIHGVDHWAAGARAAYDLGAQGAAYAIDGHHTGLPAASDLRARLLALDDEARRVDLTRCPEPVHELLARLGRDGISPQPAQAAPSTDYFAAALATRMLFSCLVDADFLDTEAHFDPAASALRSDPALKPECALDRLLHHLQGLPRCGAIGEARAALLDACLQSAIAAPGLFTLTAPTGCGKTLSSVAFALAHARAHNAGRPPNDPARLRRIIIVIPYTSIIEQTAAVLRNVFAPDFGAHYLLEHHSALAPEPHPSQDRDAESETARRARLAAENWSAPLVVTTSVQFFESLFAQRPSHCRKLHNIARSVVIFDEVQTLPPRLLPSLLSAVALLAREPYGATALFMTATQPAFSSLGAALPYGWQPVPIAWNPPPLPPRTTIRLPAPQHTLTWPEVAAQIIRHERALCVVNTTADARTLFRLLPQEGRYHLSSRLCPAHRREKLAAIRQALAAGRPCRLVSTQLIEAGVDLDFPAAFRALGPLDSIIQTAGRCNREGRQSRPGEVNVFRPSTGSLPPGPYRAAAQLTEAFLARHPDAPGRLHDAELYGAYFAELYPLIGRNTADEDRAYAASEKFDFPRAAAACRIVEDETRSVLVAWGEGQTLLDQLRREKHLDRSGWRRLQSFSINLYLAEFTHARSHGYVSEAADDVWAWGSHYDADLGACHLEGVELCL